MPVQVNPALTIPDAELDLRFGPSGGPGGQHANRAHSRVDLTWVVEDSTVLTASQRRRLVDKLGPVVRLSVDEERSQLRNRELALERLGQRVAQALKVERARRPTKPSRRAKARRVDAKRRRSQTKQGRRRPNYDD